VEREREREIEREKACGRWDVNEADRKGRKNKLTLEESTVLRLEGRLLLVLLSFE
jgi:hypothetical protein